MITVHTNQPADAGVHELVVRVRREDGRSLPHEEVELLSHSLAQWAFQNKRLDRLQDLIDFAVRVLTMADLGVAIEIRLPLPREIPA